MGNRSSMKRPGYFFGGTDGNPFTKLPRGRKIALFLDFDGTLVAIREDPAKCRLSKDMKARLRSLADSGRTCLTIMSGRSLSDVRRRVGLRNIYYGGNHGFDVSGPGLRYRHEKALSARPLVRRVKRLIEKGIAGIDGAWIEDKKFSVTLHFRQVRKGQVPLVRKVFYKAAGESLEDGSLGLIRGKKVLELTPDTAWNKGEAVLWMLRHLGHRWLPVYVGDDKTDETAFAAIGKKGITVRVEKSRITRAQYYIEDHREVPLLLEEIRKYTAL